MQMRNGFLESAGYISKNQAEYSILTDLYDACYGKDFLLQIKNLSVIKEYYTDVVKYINTNYKSFELSKFVLEDNGDVRRSVVKSIAGSTMDEFQLMNLAIEISSDGTYVLVRTNNALALMYNGFFDDRFKNTFADKQKMLEIEKDKKDIEQLEWVFDDFHLQRRYTGCEYVIAGKVSNDISEQQLRNSLIDFLVKTTKLHVVPELCTSKVQDEESVDIGVIDSDNRVAIIEVKYFVKQGFFEDKEKKAYGETRFKDGYKQLDRYCVHLKEDNYDLHSAFLYMFYAHTKTKDEMVVTAKKYLEEYLNDEGESGCSEKFRNHFKMTYCDNMLDIQYGN